MIYIGIDPGKNGGIAVLGSDYVSCVVYSDTELLNACRMFEGMNVICYLNFGMNFGFIQGVLKAYEIPYELVTPQKWKKEFSCTSDKNTSIEVCKRLFPNVNLKATDRCKKDHDGIAEALLIAEYGRRHYNGKS